MTKKLGSSYLFSDVASTFFFSFSRVPASGWQCSVVDEEKLFRNFYLVKRADWGGEGFVL